MFCSLSFIKLKLFKLIYYAQIIQYFVSSLQEMTCWHRFGGTGSENQCAIKISLLKRKVSLLQGVISSPSFLCVYGVFQFDGTKLQS